MPHGNRRRAVVAALPLLACVISRTAAADTTGLRWTGDARLAVATDAAVLGGPALHFRYGTQIAQRPKEGDGWVDVLVGSWMGVELGAGLLVGEPERGTLGVAGTLGVRPWFSRRQSGWFLETQRFSVLGALVPEAGIDLAESNRARWYLGWELPLGGSDFQIVPGLLWISPGERLPLLATLAFRVPM